MSLYFILTVLNECSDRYNDINDAYTKLCVADVVKNMNISVFNLMKCIMK